jgi:UDP-N-acetylglucosamine acyltransferase
MPQRTLRTRHNADDLIHPAAIVHAGADVAEGVEIGPYTVIGPHVVIGPQCRIGPHAIITGPTRIGAGNRIYQFVSLGEIPQDKKYGGEPTRLEIGDNNVIREFCTFNCGTVQDEGVTRVGDNNWIMAYVHLAHDCQVGSHTVFANNAQLAGHVQVGDYAILGGFTVVHQFCHIGAHSITAMGTIVLRDIPPFGMATDNSARAYGINAEGLKRRGFTAATITRLKRAYKTLYKSGFTLEQARRELARQVEDCPEVQVILDFLAGSQRGIIR